MDLIGVIYIMMKTLCMQTISGTYIVTSIAIFIKFYSHLIFYFEVLFSLFPLFIPFQEFGLYNPLRSRYKKGSRRFSAGFYGELARF